MQIKTLDDLPLNSSQEASLDARVTVMQLAAFQTQPQHLRSPTWLRHNEQAAIAKPTSGLAQPAIATPPETATASDENTAQEANRQDAVHHSKSALPGRSPSPPKNSPPLESPAQRTKATGNTKESSNDADVEGMGTAPTMSDQEWRAHEARLAALEESLLQQAKLAGARVQQMQPSPVRTLVPAGCAVAAWLTTFVMLCLTLWRRRR